MKLTNNNYYTSDANKAYWSVSQFKTFDKCEAAGLAEVRGEYVREMTDALLIGSYIDAFFSGEMSEFLKMNGDKMFKKNGEILAKFKHSDEIIDRIQDQAKMVEMLQGDKQRIFTAELFGVPWKIKTDVYNGERIVDLKIVRDFEDIYDKGFGYRSWLEYWGYDIQGAVYQKVEQLATGRDEPLPFYLVAATKEKVTDLKIIQLPQDVLNDALKIVEAKIERFDLIKSGDVEPIRCEKCDYCKATKIVTPEIYEREVK